MTWILRNAFLALVAFATLAIIIMMAMTAEAKDLSPSTTTALATSPADTLRQIVVEQTKDKTGEVITVAKGEDAVPKPAEAKPVADAEVHNTAQAPAAEAASAPQPEAVQLPKPKPQGQCRLCSPGTASAMRRATATAARPAITTATDVSASQLAGVMPGLVPGIHVYGR